MAKRSVKGISKEEGKKLRSILLDQLPGTSNPYQVIQNEARVFDDAFAERIELLREVEEVARDRITSRDADGLLPKTPSQKKTRKRFLTRAEELKKQKEEEVAKENERIEERHKRADKCKQRAVECQRNESVGENESPQPPPEPHIDPDPTPNPVASSPSGTRDHNKMEVDATDSKKKSSLRGELNLDSPKQASEKHTDPATLHTDEAPPVEEPITRAEKRPSSPQKQAKFTRTEIPPVRPAAQEANATDNGITNTPQKQPLPKQPQRRTRGSIRNKSPAKRAPIELSKAQELRLRRDQEAERRRVEQAELEEKRKKKAEALRRQQEELRRLHEKEQERARLIAKQREEERLAVVKEQKEREERERREKEERERKEKEERERREKEPARIRKEAEATQKTASKVKESNDSCDVSQNSSMSADESSYEMTPARKPQPSTDSNYGIEDLNSEDETDDESNPRKKVPQWAKGAQLKAALIRQFYDPPNVLVLFGPIYDPDLSKMFRHQRSRFRNRTSSAVWDTPLLKRNPNHSIRSEAISS